MSRLRNLLQAKYKNVSFFVRREAMDQLGQKRIIHDYPNTKARYAEPKGAVPDQFTIDLFFTGEFWQDEFDLFKARLEDPSPGRLILPTFGVFENMVALPATGESNQTSVGEISLTVKFSVTVERPSPTEATTSKEDVSEQSQLVRTELQGAFTSV
jgi:prophage DNA circulation protein